MSKTYRIEFKVCGIRGQAQGPAYDMLRYDQCYPKRESDSHRLARHHDTNHREVITLVSDDRERHWRPNVGRWSSFGYHIVEIVIKSEVRDGVDRLVFRDTHYAIDLEDAKVRA